MQLIKTASAVAAMAAVAAAQEGQNPNLFALALNRTASTEAINPQYLYTPLVSYANGSLFVGQMTLQSSSEPFIAQSGDGSIGFTSFHQVPTGFQSLYLFPEQTQPLGLTVPHTGGNVPTGASSQGFGWDEQGSMTYNGQNNFVACNASVANSWQIYWKGDANAAVLNEKDCSGPVIMMRTNITFSGM